MEKVDLSRYAPKYEINIDGIDGETLANSIISISVSEKVGGAPAEFNLVLADKFDGAAGVFYWLEKFLSPSSPLYSDDKKFEISFGYHQEKLTKMMTANLKSVSTSGFSSDITQLTLVGYDSSHQVLKDKSTGAEKEKIKIEKNDTYSTIAEKLAKMANLDSVIDKSKLYRPVTMKKNASYLEFLTNAAKLIGFEFFITRNTLYFINPRKERTISGNDNNTKKEKLVLKWHHNLQEFVPTINMANLVPEVEVRGNLPNSRKLVVKKASVGDEDTLEPKSKNVYTGSKIAENLKHKKMEITDRNFYTEEEASDIAKAELNILGDKLITASVSIVGDPAITVGQYITIEGIGKQLSGKYYITDVTHSMDGNGYSTKFNVSKNNIVLK